MKRLINGKLFTVLLIFVFASFVSAEFFWNSKESTSQAKPASKQTTKEKENKPKQETKEEFESKKIVYLTFDDGPSAQTAQLLEILKKEQVKATFFVVGKSVDSRKEMLKQIAKEGHYVGLHSITHNAKILYPSNGKPDVFMKEMTDLQVQVKELTGQNSVLIRAPYGSKPYIKPSFQQEIVAKGFHLWDWNVDSNDWRYQTEPSKILETIQTQVREDRKKHVILMHEKPGTLQALPLVIQHFKNLGYEFRAYNPEQHFPVNFWFSDSL